MKQVIIASVKQSNYHTKGGVRVPRKGFVVTFREPVQDINGKDVTRLNLSTKQYANLVEELGIVSKNRAVLATTSLLLKGARATISVNDHKKGQEYINSEGKKLKYDKDWSDVNIEEIQLTAKKEDKLLDLALTSLSSSFDDSGFDDEPIDANVPAELSAE